MWQRWYKLFSTFQRVKPTKPSKHAIALTEFRSDINGFLLYDNPSSKRFRTMNIIFLAAIAYFAAMAYFFPDPEYQIHQQICGGVCLLGFIFFQFRMRRTLKQLIMDKLG